MSTDLEVLPPLQTRETFPLATPPLGTVQVLDEAGFAYLDGDIDFGATGRNEIFQNIKYIVLTEYFSVPLDREFGLDYSLVDKPIRIAEAILAQEVTMKISLYEPRAQFREITYEEDFLNGKLSPVVKVVLLTTNELPSTIELSGTPAAAPLVTIEEIDLPGFYATLIDMARTPGPTGPEGAQGEAATIEVGITATGEPGTDALVINVGDEHFAIFDFTIPKGEKGDQGTGVNIKGTVPNSGALPTTGNQPGDMWIASDTGHGWTWDGDSWNDVGPIQGPPGPSNILSVSSTTTSAPGGNANVTIAGTSPSQSLAFVIPRGDLGPQGPAGQIWRGPWDPSTSYLANDAVEFQGSTFISTAPNLNVQPVPDTGSNWLPPLANTGNRGSLAALPPNNQVLYYARGDNTWQLFPSPVSLVPVGGILQTKYLEIAPITTSNVIIPVDGSPPQIGEGAQIGTYVFTPLFANSLVRITLTSSVASTVATNWITIAMFRNPVANSIAWQAVYQTSLGGAVAISFSKFDAPATTSPITYSFRMGPGTAATVRTSDYSTPGAMITFEEIKQ